MSTSASPMHVVIAGGGVAGLEALLALRDLAGDRVRVTLMAPEPDFVYRPMAVAAPFARGRAQRRPLREIAARFGAGYVQQALAAVDDAQRIATTASGEEHGFDALLIATGAGSVPAYKRALTWTPETDRDLFGGLLQDLEEGYTHRVAYVIPPGVAWALPAYELALMTAWDAHDMGRDDVEITVYTHEDAPLSLFGPDAASALRTDLEEAGVEVETSVAVTEGDGGLRLQPGDRPLEAQRVVALPLALGQAVEGVTVDGRGFIPVDRHGKVHRLEAVWAAGDAIAFPVKQGGLAAQQADAAAEAIAARAGADVQPQPFHPVLRGVLLTGRGRQWARRDVVEGDPEGSAARHALWWPPTKIAGRYLSPFLAELEALETPGPAGQPVQLDLERQVPAAADALRLASLRTSGGG